MFVHRKRLWFEMIIVTFVMCQSCAEKSQFPLAGNKSGFGVVPYIVMNWIYCTAVDAYTKEWDDNFFAL
jgi:hypothetical protein